MRELPAPWNDLTHRRSAALAELPSTDAAQALAVLRASLPPHRQGIHGWDDELRDSYDDRDDHTLDEADAWLTRLMPTTADVTRERMTEAMRECALLGIPGIPRDPAGEEGTRFVGRWVTWIGSWIAGEVFDWLGTYVDDDTLRPPWAIELAERYARCGVATDQAVSMLRQHHTTAAALAALARIAADDTLPPHVRKEATL
ncbi:hypothetical protein ACF1B0_14915 [Streptomyces anandii]|uniref:hypothetical protein n=1 Tax=Streptomyces anandii TaxID=285454 RepID=UPI0036FDD37B